ncbi:unnamed protein product, partial [Adineta ricciae]
ELFHQLDKDHDGRIDVDQLIKLLEKGGIETSAKKRWDIVRRIIAQAGGSPDASFLSFTEFAKYILQQENKLSLAFRKLDANSHGKFDAKDLVYYFRKFRIKLDLEEAEKLVEKMKQDNSLEITYDEWRSFFMVNPAILESVTGDPNEMLRYWRRATHLKLGETSYVLSEDDGIHTKQWWENLVAGGCAGAVSRTATAPFDRLKIIMQYLGSRQRMSIINGYRYLIREGGVKSLWHGNGMNVAKIIPETALRFAFFDETKKLVKVIQGKDLNTEATVLERFVSGAIAGFLSQTVVYPLDVLKVRLVLRRKGEVSTWADVIRQIYRCEGSKAFWRGYTLNQIGIVPYAGFDLACYESLKRLYIKSHGNREPPVYIYLTCGAISSFAGQILTYPVTLLRIRRQGQIVPLPHMDQSKAHPVLPIHVMVKEIWHKEGLVGFYRGLVPNMLKVVPAVSISYLVYETIIKALSTEKHKPFKKKWMFSSRHGSHSNELALEYFDFAYPLIFHRHWPSIRLALLSLPKPVALINPYSLSKKAVQEKLIQEGAVDLLRFDNEQVREDFSLIQERIAKSDEEYGIKKLLEQKENRRLLGTSDLTNEQEEIDDGDDDDDDDDDEDIENNNDINSFNQPQPVKSLDDIYKQALEQQVHSVVKGNAVPVVDDDKDRDYKKVPPSWHVYTFPRSNMSRFEPAKTDDLNLLDYYCMDGACVLPILALDVQPFQSVLDMCSAPGGKALNIFHSCPYIQLTCNDTDNLRWKRLVEVFTQTVPKDTLAKYVRLVKGDGCLFGQQQPASFDRVLVDVPCTSDRHALSTAFNIFSKKRVQERVDLPDYQRKLLESAIRACKPGGIVVYSTCTLAPAQNEGVVERAIENLASSSSSNRKHHGQKNDNAIKCEIVSTQPLEKHYAYFFQFHTKTRYGSLVLPHISNNFGPLYFCKIRRIS